MHKSTKDTDVDMQPVDTRIVCTHLAEAGEWDATSCQPGCVAAVSSTKQSNKSLS